MFEEIKCENCKKKFETLRLNYAGFTYTYCPECHSKIYLKFLGEDLKEELRTAPTTDLVYKYASILIAKNSDKGGF